MDGQDRQENRLAAITQNIAWACNRDDNRLHCCRIAIVEEECCKQPRSEGMVELSELLETIRRRAARKDSLSCEEIGGSDSTITDFMTDAFTADERAATTTNGLVRTASMRTPAVTATALDTFTSDKRAATTTHHADPCSHRQRAGHIHRR